LGATGSLERHWQIRPRGPASVGTARIAEPPEVLSEEMLRGVAVSQQQPEAGRVTQQQPLRNIAAARSGTVGPVPDALVVPDNTPQSAIAAINAGCRK
jgi:hypothetical protein